MKHKNISFTIIFVLLISIISLSCYLKPHTAFSDSERRPLADKPDLSLSSIASGEFVKNFDKYSADQFPMRDKFRTLKAVFATYLFNKKDNNGLYLSDGHISKIEYPVNLQMVDYAENKFNYLYQTYMKDKNVNLYLSIIPDKNYFLASKNGYLSINYDKFIEDFKNRMDYMKYIDILPKLTLNDYYKTDSHWKQENLQDVARFLANSMGTDVKSEYKVNTLDVPFSGVYLGQSALPVKPDTIKYLTNDELLSCKVSYYDTGKAETGDMYNMTKAYGKDAYEIFLSGTSALVEIENPNSKSNKELVIFRDSFASSLAPLLTSGYKKITLVDIRYINSGFLSNYIEFDNQDVLFLYSTTILNNSMSMR